MTDLPYHHDWKPWFETRTGSAGKVSVGGQRGAEAGIVSHRAGRQRGQVNAQSESFGAFLREHVGTEVTLIVARDTPEFEMKGLAHGFAGRRLRRAASVSPRLL